MRKTAIVASVALVLTLAVLSVAATGERQTAFPVGDVGIVQAPASRTACTMFKATGTASWVNGGIAAGFGFLTYYDPDVECGGIPSYPFEIASFDFTLFDWSGADVWPALVDVVVYDVNNSGDPCDGPGNELCRVSVAADQASFLYPTAGTVTFPTPCCVDRPFFIGIEYTSGSSGSTPSIVMDDQAGVSCEGWATSGPGYLDWDAFWTPPPPGYPLFWVNGETESQNCEQGGECVWNPGDPYKMHEPQLPDETGWAVNATRPQILAEDFLCTEDGPIRDVHFWGAWRGGVEGQIGAFVISFHADIAVDPPSIPYSRPGITLWEMEVPHEYVNIVPIDPPTMEGWYDRGSGEIIYDDHQAYFQYNICFDDFIDEQAMFFQDAGRIYWMNISAILVDPDVSQWGWKSTQDHWNDDAVWALWGDLDWIDLWEPTNPIMNEFWIAIDPTGIVIPERTGGVGFYPPGDINGWWFYDGPEWEFWNIWFYDHPFSYDRQKEAHIELDIAVYQPGLPSWITFVVNYSTDIWSLEGQPPGDSMPPLPGMDPATELLYIGRDTLFAGPVEQFPPHLTFDWEFLDYNPEWISIDVGGYNFIIPETGGQVYHDCIGSLDLSMVITNTEHQQLTGACCYDDPTGAGFVCIVTTPTECNQVYNGVYQGDGTVCLGIEACCMPDGGCMMVDAICCDDIGGVAMGPGSTCTQVEACCYPDGTCAMLDPLCCAAQGGVPMGPGSVCTGPTACCLPDGTCAMIDPLCCAYQQGTPHPGASCSAAPQACCLPDGQCVMTDPLCCVSELGGAPMGPGSTCTQPEACCFPDNSCIMSDPLCCAALGGTPQGPGSVCLGFEACCLPDGDCIMADALCCLNQGGTPMGPGSVCTGQAACCLQDGTCDMLDPLCCALQGGNPHPGAACSGRQACCFPDGSCDMLDQLCCLDQGGTPMGPGSTCTQPEACCLQNGACTMLDPLCCANQGGTPMGPGSTCTQPEACCLPDGQCIMSDPLCCARLNGVPQGPGTVCTQPEVCCLDGGIVCVMVDPLCCDDLGGFPSPTGAPNCLGDGNGNNIDDACEDIDVLGACCFDGTVCHLMTETDCVNNGGIYKGDYTKCAGDHDGNGADDACEDPWNPDPGDDIKMHYPQLPDIMGWDVNATYHPLGDDFMCRETGWIKDIHFWGSWRGGRTGEIDEFWVALYTDAPAGMIRPWSQPLEYIWEFRTSEFVITPLFGDDEGWFDPLTGLFLPGDHMEYFQYDIYIPEDFWFYQEEGTIYWLVLMPVVAQPGEFEWGWKTSLDHWNDDGVFTPVPWPVPPGTPEWYELRDPFSQESLDLAFVITGSCCNHDGIRGNCDGLIGPVGPIDVSDLTYLVEFLFSGGPPPPCTDEGNVDGIFGPAGPIDVADLTYLVDYLFGGGPPPLPCP